jgi:hypothetical protein
VRGVCTLNIDDNPVTIKTIECQIVDRGWEEGWIEPSRWSRPKKTGKTRGGGRLGSGGLACAQQLARAGHAVTLFEKSDRIGGLLRYGIPDFKMEKHLIDRRIARWRPKAWSSARRRSRRRTIAWSMLLADFDAVVLSGGAEAPRDLELPAASSPASISPWISSPSRTSGWPATRSPRRARRHDQRQGQACGGDRRRRYRFGLHRHLQPPGRLVGDPAGNHAPAAGAGEQGAGLAGLAAQAAHLSRPRKKAASAIGRC